jgi:nitronate monooxygenase
LAAPGAKTQATQTSGDGTARSEVFDILRRKNWPTPYDFRAIRNDLHRALESDMAGLKTNPDAARADYDAGVKAGDFTRAHATVGEVVGLIADIPSAAELIQRLTMEAGHALSL